MKVTAIIPARYNSSRFPGKPLAEIKGRPMIYWVYSRILRCEKLDQVIVATDSSLIYDACKEYNINVEMTKDTHNTSTERVYEVAQKHKSDFYIVINGDEPLIKPETVDMALPDIQIPNDEVFVVNLITRIKRSSEVVDSTNIKVVSDMNGYALFMSRNPIPYPKANLDFEYKKHLGVLGYNFEALKFFAETPKGYLEKIEDINELRFIENGKKLLFIEIDEDSLSVDTPKDLERVREIAEREEFFKNEQNKNT